MRMKRITGALSLAVVLLLNGCTSWNLTEIRYPDQIDQSTEQPSDLESDLSAATVVRVIDGDTIVVLLDNTETRIRMIGVDTPESVHPDASRNNIQGESASEYTRQYLPEDMAIWLEFDEETEDIYGRTLAYVWLAGDVDTSDFEQFREYNYGAILLQNTYCSAAYYAPNGKYREWYEQLETEFQ